MRVCPSCKGNVAGNARVCPHCGHRFWTMLAKVFFWLLVVPLLVAILWGFVASTP